MSTGKPGQKGQEGTVRQEINVMRRAAGKDNEAKLRTDQGRQSQPAWHDFLSIVGEEANVKSGVRTLNHAYPAAEKSRAKGGEYR